MKSSLLPVKNSFLLKTVKWKSIYRMLMVLVIVLSCQYAYAQLPTEPIIFNNWRILGESKDHLDVSFRVIRCDTVNQVQLQIRSESNRDEVLNCNVIIKNLSDGETITRHLSMPVLQFQELKPICGNNTLLPNLKVELPTSFNPMNIATTIHF